VTEMRFTNRFEKGGPLTTETVNLSRSYLILR
jgi:hypothetical protein